jgi:hypothetical protein
LQSELFYRPLRLLLDTSGASSADEWQLSWAVQFFALALCSKASRMACGSLASVGQSLEQQWASSRPMCPCTNQKYRSRKGEVGLWRYTN